MPLERKIQSMEQIKSWLLFLTRYKTKKKSFIILLVSITVGCFIIGNISISEKNETVKIYIYARSNDALSSAVVDELTSQSGEYSFVAAKSEDVIFNDVKHAKAQCGYILEENQVELAVSGTVDKNIILVERMGSERTDIVNELFYGAYFKEYAKFYTQSFTDNLADSDISQYFEETYDTEMQKMIANLSFKKVTTDKPVSSKEYVRNILAVIVCLWGFASVSQFVSDKKNGIMLPVPVNRRFLFRILYFGVEFGILTPIMFVGIWLQKSHKGFLYEIATILVYMLAIIIMCVICSYIFKRRLTVLCILPILTIAYVIVCPVFFSLANYFPIINILRYLCLPYYYLRIF